MEGEQKFIDINKIELDVNNPRIKRLIEGLVENLAENQQLDEKQILIALQYTSTTSTSTDKTENVMTFSKLQNSIIQNKGVLNPIIVKKLDNEHYKCIEGNTRLAIYKVQNDKHPDEDCWKNIKSTVYERITERGENNIRLQCHLVPPRPWEPFSRAKYLNQLVNVDEYDIEEIGGVCGMASSEIQNYIEAFQIMEENYRPLCIESGDTFDVKSFSGFYELVLKPSLQGVLIENNFDFKDFSRWIHNREKIKQLSHVRQLERILKNGAAKRIFLRTGSKDALEVFIQDGGENLQNAGIMELMRATIVKLNLIPYFEMKTLAEETTLLDDSAQLISLCKQCIDDNA
jgi:hypothetical protein